jgi:CheY-like chemotaxis protein
VSPSALILDDSITIRTDLRGAFFRAGYRVTACNSIASARKALQGSSFDIVILDMQLPDGSGLELLRAIRGAVGDAYVPVLMLSSAVDVEKRVRSLGLSADDYFGKPYDVSALVARANELTEARPRSTPRPRLAGREERGAGETPSTRPPPSGPRAFGSRDMLIPGSLLHRVFTETGLVDIIGPGTIARACERAGVDAKTSEPTVLARALPAIYGTLRLFLTPEESDARMQAIARLLRVHEGWRPL